MKYGLIGEKLGHSFSKEIHNELGNLEYLIHEVKKEDLDNFISDKDFLGINVTIPYKQDVIKHLDYIDESAKAINAVNTIVNKDGKLYGYNTDYYGLALSVKKICDIENKNVFILGTGGTSNTAYAVCKDLKARSIIKVSRNKKENTYDYDELIKHSYEVDFIINCSPCGMYPNNDDCPIDLANFENCKGVIDVIYNPLMTKLTYDAKSLNIPYINGLYMLVAQAVKADSLFFDKPLDEKVIDVIYNKLVKDKMNIVLIGMPTSGKTSNGKLLSQMLNKKFVDLDDELEKYYQKSISDIFKNEGEEKFREYESNIISIFSKQNNQVIATGGGCILKEINILHLKQNGIIYFIDRDLSNLIITSNRPTANDIDKMKNLYNARYDLYKRYCDVCIDGNRTIDEICNQIGGLFNENTCN